MNDNISASAFIELWKEFWPASLANKKFDESKGMSTNLTEQIIGNKITQTNNGSPLGDFIMNYFKGNLTYIKEDCLFDLSVYYSEEFKKVWNYEVDEKAVEIDTRSNTLNAILVEHENEILHTHQEMIKLTYVKARLKVIIVYDRWDDIEFAKKRLGGNLKQIIYQANSRLVEPLTTEYLLIIGNSSNHNNIDWNDRTLYYSVNEY
jgi:hypothetical protein